MGFCLGGGGVRYTTGRRPDAATCVWYGQPLTEVLAWNAPRAGAPIAFRIRSCESTRYALRKSQRMASAATLQLAYLQLEGRSNLAPSSPLPSLPSSLPSRSFSRA